MKMPTTPNPAVHGTFYAKDQLIAYGEAVREACAKECEIVADNPVSASCAEAIRSDE